MKGRADGQTTRAHDVVENDRPRAYVQERLSAASPLRTVPVQWGAGGRRADLRVMLRAIRSSGSRLLLPRLVA